MTTAMATPTRVCRQIWSFRVPRRHIGTCPQFGEAYRRPLQLPVPVPAAKPETYEWIDEAQLGAKLNVPKSWVARHSRAGCKDPIPSAQFGRYRRYAWGSPALGQWIASRMQR